MEILVARGTQPAFNAMPPSARPGRLDLFLDDDTRPLPGNLRRAVEHFASPDTAIVRRTQHVPGRRAPLEQLFAVRAEQLAGICRAGAVCGVRSTRATSEKELILCNWRPANRPCSRSAVR